MDLHKIKNIIFDLGGVIIDIDPNRSFQALQAFVADEENGTDLFSESVSLFLDYEKGMISSDEFRKGIRTLARNDSLHDQQIDEAWNAMLLDIPLDRINVLKKLKSHYSLYVLSNTNDIHVPAFNSIVAKVCGESDIACFFDKVYFSHELQLRKPDPAIYAHVLKDNNLKPEETLFIDDRYENIKAAEALGIKTFLVEKERDIVAFFENI